MASQKKRRGSGLSRSQAAKRVWKEKKDFQKLAEELIALGKRGEGFGEDWTIAEIREYKQLLEDGGSHQYANWRIQKAMIEAEDEEWNRFRKAMQRLGLTDHDIRGEWFSPSI